MAGLVIDEGLTDRMAGFYGNAASAPPNTLRLFTSVTSGLTRSSVVADFVEVTAINGYVEKAVAGADWSFALDLILHLDVASATYIWLFTPGPGVTILGWYLLNSAAGRVQLAEQFAAPVIIPAVGGSLELQIQDTYQQCP